MAIKYANSFWFNTVDSQTSEETGYPASNLPIRTRPFRGWRSTSTAQQDIVFAMTTSRNVVSVYLLDANFTSCEIAHSNSSGGPWTDLASSPYTISQDVHDRYYKLYTGEGGTDQYWRLRIPNQSTTDGAAYFSLGSVMFVPNFAEISIPDNSGPVLPMPMELVQPRYEAGPNGRDSIPVGPRYLIQNWTATMQRASLTSAWSDLQAHDLSNPVLVYFNRGQSEEAYFIGHIGTWQLDIGAALVSINAQFRQVT